MPAPQPTQDDATIVLLESSDDDTGTQAGVINLGDPNKAKAKASDAAVGVKAETDTPVHPPPPVPAVSSDPAVKVAGDDSTTIPSVEHKVDNVDEDRATTTAGGTVEGKEAEDVIATAITTSVTTDAATAATTTTTTTAPPTTTSAPTTTTSTTTESANLPPRTREYDIMSDLPNVSLYDVHRQPRALITDTTEFTCNMNLLHSEFTCPVCFDIIKQTMTVKECLHRFCADCISRSLRLGKRECPSCRVKCASKRELRPDPAFDRLIATAFPDLDTYEEKQDEIVRAVVADKDFKRATQKMEEHKAQQAAARRLPRPKLPPKPKKKKKRGRVGRPRKNAPLSSADEPDASEVGDDDDHDDMEEEEEGEEEGDEGDQDVDIEGGNVKKRKKARYRQDKAGEQGDSGDMEDETTDSRVGVNGSAFAKLSRPNRRALISQQSDHVVKVRPITSPVTLNPDKEILFYLLRHPEEKRCAQLVKARLRTSVCLRLRHLFYYLSQKLGGHISPSHFQISVLDREQGTIPLPGDMELTDVYMQFWSRTSLYFLYYFVTQ